MVLMLNVFKETISKRSLIPSLAEIFYRTVSHSSMLIKSRRKRTLSITMTRRMQLWNIVIVVFVCFYSSLYSFDTYFSNFQLRRQQQRIIYIEELQGQSHQTYRQSVSPATPTFFVVDDPYRTDILDGQQTRNENKLSGTEDMSELQEVDVFPRWRGTIALVDLHRAIDVSMSGQLRFNRVHRINVVSDHGKLYHVNVPRPPQADQAPYRRAKTMETFAMQVLKYVRKIPNDDDVKYPYLKALLREGGFAYIANYADSKFCADTQPFVDKNGQYLLNTDDIAIVPIFTLASPVHCQRAFPIPTYETIEQSKVDWSTLIPIYRATKYKRSEQIRKAIWRGAPTGDRNPYHNTRIQLCIHGSNRPDILDVKTVTRRRQWDYTGHSNITDNRIDNGTVATFDESQYLGNKMMMDDFQKYRAIIDMDGHSWSSRFGKLLCYNSIIVKVQPDDVDFFHPKLQPWVHYIPVHSNLSNLYDMVTYAVSDDPRIAQTIQNANDWCMRHINHPSLIRDMASIWDKYSYHLLLSYQNTTTATSSTTPTLLQQQQDIIKVSSLYGIDWRNHRQILFRNYNFTLIHK